MTVFQAEMKVGELCRNGTNVYYAYSLNNGYITDISVLPYIREQQVVVRSKGMLVNTNVVPRFDNVDVSNYVRKSNIIELTNVNGTFNENDVLGYTVSGTFYPTARVVGVYTHPNNASSNTRLYVAADASTTQYSNSSKLQNGFYDTNSLYQGNTAFGTIVTSKHFGGRAQSFNSVNKKVVLSTLASSTDNY